MTPAQWDEMASVVFGGVDDAIGYVTRVLAGLDGSQGFLVYTVYDVEPSSTPWVEEDPEVERLDRLARERFEGIGVWSPYPASGEVRDLPGD